MPRGRCPGRARRSGSRCRRLRIQTFVHAIRTVLADGAPISQIDGLPPELAASLAEREASIDAALTAVDQAAAAGDLTAARQGIDQYGFHRSGIATLAGEAGATCGPAEPARVDAASVNAWLELPPDRRVGRLRLGLDRREPR